MDRLQTDHAPGSAIGAAIPDLILGAPVDGIPVLLTDVPDPVFAAKTMGPGIALEPTSELVVAPVDGTISLVHRAGHAITITSADRAEILLHVGLDTVLLKGEGFEPLVAKGQRVKIGEPLLRFDAGAVARKAKSLLTIMVVTNAPPAAQVTLLVAGRARAGTPLVRLAGRDGATAGAARSAGDEGDPWVLSRPLVPADPAGMHARPAAELASLAKKFSCTLELVKADRSADLRSVISVLGLEIGAGDEIRVRGRGADAEAAVPAVVSLLQRSPAAPERPRSSGKVLRGVCASPGVVAGVVHQLRETEPEIAENGGSVSQETARLEAALGAVRAELAALRDRLGGPQAAIFAAHLELLDDPSLQAPAREELVRGRSADYAWKFAYTLASGQISRLKNALLAARANDIRDVGRRLERQLRPAAPAAELGPDGAILIAEDLTPSDIAAIDPRRVRGLCSVTGGPSSHVAILARSLDLPAVVAIDKAALSLANGTPVILRATEGELERDPGEAELRQLAATQERQRARQGADRSRALEPATTRDGKRIEVAANLKGAAEARGAVELGAEGVGLLRTEFLFLDRSAAPTEEEQLAAYREIARAFGRERPLVIRTLDVGGDKPLSYLPLPKEENPFLGERGIRVSLRNLPSFREQLRAILRVAGEANVHVMFPMIATLAELRAARQLLEEERARIGARTIPVGVMVEVPSVALLAEHFARETDFFSIGSNDLSQYTLAIDRGHPKLAGEVDGLDPSVLRLIERSVTAAHAEKKWVGVCGGIASDPQAVPLLLGLGVDELSVSVPTLPAVKARIRGLDFEHCRQLAIKALAAGTAAEVRALVPLE